MIFVKRPNSWQALEVSRFKISWFISDFVISGNEKLNFQRPTVSWKLFSSRFINAVMTAHASSIAEYGVLHLEITSFSVLASHSTRRQTQSGSIRFKNFQIYLSFEIAGRNV